MLQYSIKPNVGAGHSQTLQLTGQRSTEKKVNDSPAQVNNKAKNRIDTSNTQYCMN